MNLWRKRLLLLPVLFALTWGACYDPEHSPDLTRRERDVRALIIGFSWAMMALIIASVANEEIRKGFAAIKKELDK